MLHPQSQAQQFVDALNKAAAFKVWSFPWRERAAFAALSPVEQADTLRQYAREVLSDQPQILRGTDEAYAANLKLGEAFNSLKEQFGARYFKRNASLLLFPDRSGALRIEPERAYSIKVGAQSLYRDLTWDEAERWLDTGGHFPRHDLFMGQIPVHDDVFFLYRRETWREMQRHVRYRDLPLGVNPYPEMERVHILGHARGLMQCAAVVDGRTWPEKEADRQRSEAWAALSDAERADLEAGGELLWQRENPLGRMLNSKPLTPEQFKQAARARLWRMRGPKQRPGLHQNVYIRVDFWLAWVWKDRNGEKEPVLYFVHPYTHADDYALDMRMEELAQQARARLAGEKKFWRNDNRRWFTGRDPVYDPLVDEVDS